MVYGGDMGTRASEKTLMKTPAGRAPGSGGMDAHMGRAVKHLKANHADAGSMKAGGLNEKIGKMRDSDKGNMDND